jgi:hypothetical protein
MPRSGPRQIYMCSKEFKLAAVRLSHVPGIQVKAVAPGPAREIARLQQFEREHALLQEEHDLQNKDIRFCASRKRTSSRSSTSSARTSGPGDNAHMESFFHSMKAEATRGLTHGVNKSGARFRGLRKRAARACYWSARSRGTRYAD